MRGILEGNIVSPRFQPYFCSLASSLIFAHSLPALFFARVSDRWAFFEKNIVYLRASLGQNIQFVSETLVFVLSQC